MNIDLRNVKTQHILAVTEFVWDVSRPVLPFVIGHLYSKYLLKLQYLLTVLLLQCLQDVAVNTLWLLLNAEVTTFDYGNKSGMVSRKVI